MSCGADTVELAFDALNPEAEAWAERNAARLVREIKESTRASLRAITARAFREGIPPRQAARLVYDLVGLTERQTRAAMRFRARLVAKGVRPAAVERRTARYAEKLRRARALTIARTETMRAGNEGQRQLWLQARKAGYLEPQDQRRWITTPDERLCPICAPLDGATADLEIDVWTKADGERVEAMLPAHPNCRCTAVLEPKPKDVMAAPTASAPTLPVRPSDAVPLPSPAKPKPPKLSERGIVRDYQYADDVLDADILAAMLGDVDVTTVIDEVASGLPVEAGTRVRAWTTYTGKSPTVKFDLYDKKTGIEISRRFMRTPEGRLIVKHDLFQLEESLRGKGIAKQVLEDSFALYRRLGVDEVALNANISAGAYAWAKFGFKAVNPSELYEQLDDTLEYVVGRAGPGAVPPGFGSPKISARGQSELRRLIDDYKDDPKLPWVVADHPEGRMLLANLDWDGTMDMADSEAVARLRNYLGRGR